MDFTKIFTLVMELAARIKQDLGDKKITVDELIGEIKLVVDDLGFGDVVILDLSKEEEKKEE
ncbi:MAG: hypothetical protein DRG27_03160 [Deltaproteobacteria bacterium]|nr:MAG: hypothetical protein DRG27_03160 [Deltaproteobacteria bacterium]